MSGVALPAAPFAPPRATDPVRTALPLRIIEAVGLAAIYYAVARLGLAAGALTGNVTPVWPPTGLAIAALVVRGRGAWPGVFLGALAVNGASAVPLGPAVGMALGNTAEALAGAWLLVRWARLDPRLGRIRDVAALVVLAAGLSTVVSATIGVSSLVAGGVIPTSAAALTWRTWWLGDALGALVVAPLLLVVRPGRFRTRPGVVAEVAFVGSGLVLLSVLAFTTRLGLPYLVFPPLAYCALRWRQVGAVLATTTISAVAVVQTTDGHGAFAYGSATRSLWMLDTFLAVVATSGLVLAAVVTERDRASARNDELTGALRRNIAELEATNQELEAFTYTVSHDLRAPLRTINGFSRLLVKRCTGQLDDEATHYLDRIRANTTAMGTLIDELLDFSRLQRRPLETRPTALRYVVDDALAVLEPDPRVVVQIGDLPTWEVDRALFTQVFVNLLGNAVKFSRTQETPRIEIGSDASGGVYVRDNGVGFDPQYAAKMFGVFQRLHRAEDFEGTGVGLAIVERIVTRHGGQIRAEGSLGAGACVTIELPEAPHARNA